MTIELTEEQVARLLIRDDYPKQPTKRRIKITGARDVYRIFRHMENLRKEHVRLLTLTTHRRVLANHEVSVGVLDASLVHPREVFHRAIVDNAEGIILVHNHPSGEVDPSEDDIFLTKRLVAAGKVLGIAVYDHIIVGGGGYYSLMEHGRM